MLWHKRKVMPGFVIMSWMIQFVLCLFLGLVLFSLFAQWQKKIRTMHNNINQLLAIPIALDALKRDVQSAERSHIQVQHEEVSLYMLHEHKKVSWLYDEHKIIRKQQIYDIKHSVWKRGIKNLAVNHVELCSFSQIATLQSSLLGISIKVTLLKDQSKKHYVIALRNGKVI